MRTLHQTTFEVTAVGVVRCIDESHDQHSRISDETYFGYLQFTSYAPLTAFLDIWIE